METHTNCNGMDLWIGTEPVLQLARSLARHRLRHAPGLVCALCVLWDWLQRSRATNTARSTVNYSDSAINFTEIVSVFCSVWLISWCNIPNMGVGAGVRSRDRQHTRRQKKLNEQLKINKKNLPFLTTKKEEKLKKNRVIKILWDNYA